MDESFENGVVTIDLGGESVDLCCTPNAVFKLSRVYGGMTPILQKLQAMELEVFIAIIRAGANLNDKESSDLVGKVFKAGMLNLMNPLVEYVTLLCTGGTNRNDESESKKQGKL